MLSGVSWQVVGMCKVRFRGLHRLTKVDGPIVPSWRIVTSPNGKDRPIYAYSTLFKL